MNPNPHLVERLAQQNMAEAERLARQAYLDPRPRPVILRLRPLAVVSRIAALFRGRPAQTAAPSTRDAQRSSAASTRASVVTRPRALRP